MGDICDNAAASAMCDNAYIATKSKACSVTDYCPDLCVATQEHDLAQSKSGSGSNDKPHRPAQVSQLTDQISQLKIDKDKISKDKVKPNSSITKKPSKKPKEIIIPESPAEVEKLYGNILRSSSSKKISAHTCILDPNKVSKDLVLQDAARDITRKMGLHEPVLRMSSQYYCPGMEMNNGGMDYVNVLRSGGPRLWLFVLPDDNEKLEKLVLEMLKKDRAEEPANSQNSQDEWLPDCHTPLMHTSLAIAPEKLREAGIRFQIFTQYAGDVVCVRPNLMTQVIDLGWNINEQANIGSDMWLENFHKFDICACDHQGVRALDLSPYKDILRKHFIKARKKAKKCRSKKK